MSATPNIPLVDLGWQRDEIAAEVGDGWARVLATTGFVGGPEVAAFEDGFAAFSGSAHCVGVANGTDAVELALRAAGLGPGDRVAIPANTFVATAGAVLRMGAVPVPVDVDDEHLLIDPASLADVAPGCDAVVPVHLFGQLAPMREVAEVARAHGLVVVEDGAQAQGARQHDTGLGSGSAAAATSFYPGKNLGAYGDGGAVLTDDHDVARRVRMVSNHGSEVRYQHPVAGFNSRLDPLQAVVLRAKLGRLEEWNRLRRSAAETYHELLSGVDQVRLPVTAPDNEHVWHLYVVRVPNRNLVLSELASNGVGAGVHYPVPVHLTGALEHLGHGPGDFPVAERAAGEILSLPLYPGITRAQQDHVAEALTRAVTRAAA